jgi:hypothetical protein
VSQVTAGLVADYNVAPLGYVTCVDQSTRVLCSGNLDTTSFPVSASVTYPTPDTTAPQVTLNGSASETVSYGASYIDA